MNITRIATALCILISLPLCAAAKTSSRPRITFVTPSIVHVQWSADGSNADNNTGVCVYDRSMATEAMSSTEIIVERNDAGALTFRDAHTGAILLSEDAKAPHYAEPVYQEHIIYDEASAHTEKTANGDVTVRDIISRDTVGVSTRYRVAFSLNDERALYGLGAHMEDYMNLLGKTLYLTQHNLKAMVPFLVSTKGYGLLFDAGCAMKYESEGDVMTMQLEAAKTLDYYFIKGNDMYDVIEGYHYLTGKPSLMPRWLFGYTQSKERYVSSDDLISTLREYRRRHVPIDMIVQDWNYWPEGWGYMKMNPKYYPDPKALADSIHAMNAKLMVSIWPNPQWCPEAEDFKQRGYMLPHDVYDVFNPEARKYYWKYANDEFFSRGFDAWWCDSSEPLDGDWNRPPTYSPDGKKYSWDDHAYRWQLNKNILSEALGAERSSLYSLYHSMGIYENQRKATDDKRVVNLTRSTYAGQQRYGTIVWNGDTHASWQSFRQQIPASLNYMATGNPYWTVDVGSFFVKDDGRRWFYKGEFQQGVEDDEYKEYYVRMFQWGTFLPMLRSHGSDTPREIWRFGEPGTKFYDAILAMINLRYEHIPYIYSLAAQQSLGKKPNPSLTNPNSSLTNPNPSLTNPNSSLLTLHSSLSMSRPLAFDFAADDAVLDIKDEYMFGDYLVCPVTHPGVTTRKVYLPKGVQWTDYWTGTIYDGGQWLDADCALPRLPLFVRAGSIIPTTEVAEYADAQIGKPVTINVYPGKDADFFLYEDEGDNYNYEHGAFAVTPIHWDDARHVLTIHDRQGSYASMPTSRTFIVKLAGVGSNHGEKRVKYSGKKVKIKQHGL